MKYGVIIILLIGLWTVYVLKKKNKLSDNNDFICQTFFWILLLEFSIFNIHSYRMDFSKAREMDFSGEVLEQICKASEDSLTITLENLDCEVDTIYLELGNSAKNQYINYDILYSDASTKGSILAHRTYCDEVEKTKYTSIHLAGDAKKLELIVTGKNLEIEQVSLNKKIPFEFNLVRVCLLILLVLFCRSLKTQEFWNLPYHEKNASQAIAFLALIDSVILVVFFFQMSCTKASEPVSDLYNTKLVSSLAKGQLYLEDEPSEALLQLQNPYDFMERRENLQRDLDYIWDAVLYDGHYYVYFGIVPAILLLLPYHLLTGKFMLTSTAVLIFSVLAVVVLAILGKEIFKKFFKKVSFKMMFFSILMLLVGTLLIWINIAPRFYELVTVAGLFFGVLGFLLIFTSEKEEGKLVYWKVVLGALSLALAVGCRPTQIFTSFLIVPFLVRNLKNSFLERKNFIKFILSIGIPYFVVGVALMWYNQARFGSVFEFGSNYQLTVNDMKSLGFRFSVIPTGIMCDLFNLPVWKTSFPFISGNGNILDTFAYYYVEDIPGGVFFLSPIAFACFGIVGFWKSTKEKNLKILVSSLLGIGLILVMFVTAQAGSTGRYFLDFAWMFVFTGILIFVQKYENCKQSETKKVLEKIFMGIAAFTVVINILLGFAEVGGNGMKIASPKTYLKAEYGVSIWK